MEILLLGILIGLFLERFACYLEARGYSSMRVE